MIKIYQNYFGIFNENNLTIKSQKYLFYKPEMLSYGHKTLADDIKPLDGGINTIFNFQDLTSAKEIGSFLD